MYNPQKYSRNLDPFVDIAKELFQNHWDLLKWNSESESILDLGIGDGRITKEVILPLIPCNIQEYIGCDISDTMLYQAAKTIDLNKFKTYQLDASTRSLPCEMKSRFDHIVSSFLLQLMNNSNIR